MTIAIVFLGGAGLVLLWTLSSSTSTEAADAGAAANLHEQNLQRSATDRLIGPALISLGAALNKLTPPGRLAALRAKIALAGKQTTWNVAKAMALKALFTIIGTAAAIALLLTGPSLLTIIGAALLVGVGYFAVDYHLDKAGSARQAEIQMALPDILDQITVCVEAGLGFDAALQRVAVSNHNLLADELSRTLQDIRLGVPRAQALHGLLDRTDVQDLRLFVRALIQAERSGIPIARVLLVQSDEVREKRRQAAEERAMKLPVLLVMPLVLCILPSLFTVIMGPAVLRMIKQGAV
jgi:tight adherence protein C